MQQIKAGKLKALAVTSAQRSRPPCPTCPPIEEAGGPALKGYEASSGSACWPRPARRWTSSTACSRRRAKALASPALKERLQAQGAIPSGMTPAEFTRFIAAETTKWAEVVKASGAKVDWVSLAVPASARAETQAAERLRLHCGGAGCPPRGPGSRQYAQVQSKRPHGCAAITCATAAVSFLP